MVRNPGLGAFSILARCAEKKIPANVAGRGYKVGEAGAESEPRVLLTTDAPLVPPEDPFLTVLSIAKEKPLWSGHAGPEAVNRMAGTPYPLAEPAGRGWAITFLDDPNFRGFWLGTALMFGNAAVFAPSFEP